MKNQKLSIKLAVGFLSVVLITLLVGWVGFNGISQVNGALREVVDVRMKSITVLAQAQEFQWAIQRSERTLLYEKDPEITARQYRQLQARWQELDQGLKTYEGLPHTQKQLTLFQQFILKWAVWKDLHRQVMALIGQGDAASLHQAHRLSYGPARDAFQEAHDLLHELFKVNLEAAESFNANSLTSGHLAQTLGLGGTLFGASLVILLGALVSRSIQRSYREMDQVLVTVGAGMMVVDKDFRVHRLNPALAAIVGADPAAAVGRKCYRVAPSNLCHTPDCPVQRIFQGEERVEGLMEKEQPDGSRVPCLFTATPLKDHKDQIVGAVEQVVDISEFKQMTDLLREREERLRLALEGSNDGFWDWDLKTNAMQFNSRWAEMLGYRLEELEPHTRTSERLTHPEDRAHMEQMLQEHLTGRLPQYECEHRMQTKSGDWRWFLTRGKVVAWDGDGHPLRLAGIHTDITERKLAAEALRQAEENLRALVSASPLAIISTDLEGKVNIWNQAAERMYGWRAPEVLGQPIPFVPDDEREESHRLRELVTQGETITGLELRRRRQDGSLVDINLSIAPLRDPQGQVYGLMWVSADITARKQAEEALRQSEERLRTLFDTAGAIIVMIGPDGRILEVNREAERVTGWSREEILGQQAVERFVPPEFQPQVQEDVFRILTGKTARELEFPLLAKEGGPRMSLWNGSPLLDPEGRVIGLIGVGLDITARKEAEEALRESQRSLEAVVETAPTLIVLVDPEGRIKLFNRACEELTGYTREEALDQPLMDLLVPPEWIPAVLQRFADPYAPAVREPHENPWLTKEGGQRLIEWRCTVLPAPQGGPPWVLGLGIDLTERRQAEQLFNDMIVSAPIGIYIVQHGKFRLVNPGFQGVTGYRAEELLERDCLQAVLPEDHQRLRENAIQMLRGKLPHPYEYRIRRKDGEIRWIMERLTSIQYQGKRAALGYFMDITTLKEAEERLVGSLSRIQKTLDGTVKALAATLEKRDPYTASHQRRVTRLACAIAQELGLEGDRLQGLRTAAVLHDIGKVHIPVEILSKPGKLTEIEYGLIKVHPQVAFDILKTIEFTCPVAQTVLQHHERLNGSGYPHGLSQEDILLEARILAVADVVEAMASHRPFRPSLGLDKGLEEILDKKGVLYDPVVVDACLRLFQEKGFQLEGQVE